LRQHRSDINHIGSLQLPGLIALRLVAELQIARLTLKDGVDPERTACNHPASRDSGRDKPCPYI
jgi:hypothetical protein